MRVLTVAKRFSLILLFFPFVVFAQSDAQSDVPSNSQETSGLDTLIQEQFSAIHRAAVIEKANEILPKLFDSSLQNLYLWVRSSYASRGFYEGERNEAALTAIRYELQRRRIPIEKLDELFARSRYETEDLWPPTQPGDTKVTIQFKKLLQNGNGLPVPGQSQAEITLEHLVSQLRTEYIAFADELIDGFNNGNIPKDVVFRNASEKLNKRIEETERKTKEGFASITREWMEVAGALPGSERSKVERATRDRVTSIHSVFQKKMKLYRALQRVLFLGSAGTLLSTFGLWGAAAFAHSHWADAAGLSGMALIVGGAIAFLPLAQKSDSMGHAFSADEFFQYLKRDIVRNRMIERGIAVPEDAMLFNEWLNGKFKTREATQFFIDHPELFLQEIQRLILQLDVILTETPELAYGNLSDSTRLLHAYRDELVKLLPKEAKFSLRKIPILKRFLKTDPLYLQKFPFGMTAAKKREWAVTQMRALRAINTEIGREVSNSEALKQLGITAQKVGFQNDPSTVLRMTKAEKESVAVNSGASVEVESKSKQLLELYPASMLLGGQGVEILNNLRQLDGTMNVRGTYTKAVGSKTSSIPTTGQVELSFLFQTPASEDRAGTSHMLKVQFPFLSRTSNFQELLRELDDSPSSKSDFLMKLQESANEVVKSDPAFLGKMKYVDPKDAAYSDHDRASIQALVMDCEQRAKDQQERGPMGLTGTD